MRHSVVRILPYTPEQLFDLVGDVEAYPDFVPWIVGMRIWNKLDDGLGGSGCDAEASIGFTFLKERFSTRVRRKAQAGEITVTLIHGPFKHLTNRWRFTPDPTGTRVDFLIDFEFKSKALTAMLRANFAQAVDKLMTCFEDRAKALYGAGEGE